MTIHHVGCRMAARDFNICRAIVETAADPGSSVVRHLRRKLSAAAIAPDGGIDPLVVTLNSRVEFQVDGEAPQTRILVGGEFRNGLVGMTLPVSTPRGAALLGLRQGQRCLFEEGGRAREMRVLRLAWQPQAARLGRSAVPPCPRPASPAPPAGDGARIIDLASERNARLAQSSPSPAKGTRN